MKRQNVRTLSLIVFTFTYLLVGAAVFDALESSYEIELFDKLHEQEKFWKNKYKINKQDYENLTNLIIRMKPYKAGTQWKFAGSFYFATTVITTIGYGHSTPKTNGGKIFCMLYALPGIPLCIVMFQSIGERMNTIITSAIKSFKHFFQLSIPHQVSHTSLMLISSNIVVVVIISGAAVFQYYESWSYLDSFYYCFITLTTIGFGDFVALQRNDTLAKRPDYVAFSLIFILFGLTVVSSVMNLLVLRFLTMNTEDERRDEIQAAAAAVYAYDQVRSHNNSISNGMVDFNQNSNNVNYLLPVPFDNTDRNHDENLCPFVCCYSMFKHSRTFDVNNSKSTIHKRRKRQRIDEIASNFRTFNFRNWCCLNGSASVFPVNSVAEFSQPCRKRKRYTIIRDPAKVHHLAHSNCSNAEIILRKNPRRFQNSSKVWKDARESIVIAQWNFPTYLCPPQKALANSRYVSHESLVSNKQHNEIESLVDDEDISDIFLDQPTLNSIKKIKRASI